MWRGGRSLAYCRDAWRRSCHSWQSRLLSLSSSSTEVTIVEVGPRDGLQNETTTPLTVNQRVELVRLLARAGCPKIEVGSFVSPKWVPAMANSDQVYERLHDLKGTTTLSCLVPNTKGMQDAQRVQVDEIAIFAAASESFSQKNINCSIDESMARYTDIIKMAKHSNIPVRGYLSCVVACPYEGSVDPRIVAQRTQQLLDMGCYEVSLGETIGVATAASTRDMLQAVIATVPAERLAVHFHDTYGQAVANTLVALEEFDIRVVDAAVAGLGGCPYAPGAAGNLATEDLLYLLDGLGVTTGVDMARLVEGATFVSDILGRPSRSKAGVAFAAKQALCK